MKIATERLDGIVVVRLEGELDGAGGLAALTPVLEGLLAAGDVKWVLDFETLQFVHSSALGYLIAASQRARRASGEVVVARPSSFVARLLMTLGVGTALPVFPTLDAAVTHLRATDGGAKRRR
jgi:anti-sigma B factor antagonist